MDGLREDAAVLFVLTTNHPQILEAALASRPGRIDQAIEFPLPDERGRRQLVRLYACGLPLDDDVVESTVRRTKGPVERSSKNSCDVPLSSIFRMAATANSLQIT